MGKDQVGLPQCAYLRLSVRELETEIASRFLRTQEEDQRIDLRTAGVDNDEVSSFISDSNTKENFVACRNTNFDELKTLFDLMLRLIVEQSFEVLSVSTMMYLFFSWRRSTLCHVIKWAETKMHVYQDSVLCLRKTHDHSEANEKWRSQLKDFQQTNEYTELFGIDAEPIELE